MPKFETFGEFVRIKFKTQANAAKLLKTKQNVISNWVTGRNRPEPDMQVLLFEKYGYDGGWPSAKTKEATTGITREEFAEYRGSVKAEVSMLKDGLEKALELIRDLASRLPPESRPKGY